MFVAFLISMQTATLDQKFEQLKQRADELTKMVAIENSPEAERCREYLGKIVSPLSFDSAIASVGNPLSKGEFETTPQFEVRRASVTKRNLKRLVISVPVDRDFLEYNADDHALEISPYAFGELGTKADAGTAVNLFLLLSDSTETNIIGFDTQVLVPVQSNDIVTGAYNGQNAFGASVRISKIDRLVKIIFDNKGDESETSEEGAVFPMAKMGPNLIGTLPLSVSAAKALKSSLRLALVVEPKAPYYLRKTDSKFREPTVSSPRAVSQKLSVLIADIQCGLVMNGQGKVLGAYPTR